MQLSNRVGNDVSEERWRVGHRSAEDVLLAHAPFQFQISPVFGSILFYFLSQDTVYLFVMLLEELYFQSNTL